MNWRRPPCRPGGRQLSPARPPGHRCRRGRRSKLASNSGVSAGGEAAAGASLRPKGSRAIAGLSIAFRIRTMRGLGAMAESGAAAGADVSLDLWADTRRTLAAARLCRRDSRNSARVSALWRACIRARAAAGFTLLRGCVLRRRGTRSFGDLHRCAIRMAKGDDTRNTKRTCDAPEQQGARRNAQLAAQTRRGRKQAEFGMKVA